MIQDDYFNKEDTPLAVGAAIAGSVMCLATLLFT